VYWRASALLAAVLLLPGCDDSNHRPPTPTAPRLSPRALDAQHQRLVRDYQPVSRALTGYEISFREVQAGRLPRAKLIARARDLREVVARSFRRLRQDPATGSTAEAKALLVGALVSRRRALDALVAGAPGYRRRWNRSIVLARRGLTKLQDIRDEARLIPLPEDSIS
jgi:predicted RNA-binding Zn ribbon-like protein